MPQSSIIYAATPTTTTTASTTWYGPLCSVGALLQLETSEAPAQVTFRGTGTLKNFYARGHTNSRGTGSTVNFRVAGASAVSLTIPAGNTASVTDLSSTVALADGNLWNSSITTGTGAGALGVTLSCELQTPGDLLASAAEELQSVAEHHRRTFDGRGCGCASVPTRRLIGSP